MALAVTKLNKSMMLTKKRHQESQVHFNFEKILKFHPRKLIISLIIVCYIFLSLFAITCIFCVRIHHMLWLEWWWRVVPVCRLCEWVKQVAGIIEISDTGPVCNQSSEWCTPQLQFWTLDSAVPSHVDHLQLSNSFCQTNSCHSLNIILTTDQLLSLSYLTLFFRGCKWLSQGK